MFQWVRVGLGGVVRHDGQAAVTCCGSLYDCKGGIYWPLHVVDKAMGHNGDRGKSLRRR